MSYSQDKEKQELEKLYPEGSVERQVLDYSRTTHKHDEVPPLLLGAFKILMGISILYAIVSLVAVFSSY